MTFQVKRPGGRPIPFADRFRDEDVLDGILEGHRVSFLVERNPVGKAVGANMAPLADPSPVEKLCEAITSACRGLTPKKSYCKAVEMGFIPE